MLDSLKKRVLFAFIISLAIFCATLIVGYKKYTDQSVKLENYLQRQYSIHAILYRSRSGIIILENMLYKNRSGVDNEIYNRSIDDIKKSLSIASEMIVSNNKLIQSEKAAFILLKIESIIKLLESKGTYKEDMFTLIKSEFDSIESLFLHQLDARQKIVVDEIESVKKSIILYSTLIMIALFISLVYLANLFLRPVLKLNASIEELLENEFDIKKRIPADDCQTGHLAENFNRFLDRVQYLDEKLQQRAETLEQKVKEEVEKNREKDVIMIKQSHSSAIGEMIENISHQWRQPLNALGLTIQDIEDAYDYDELSEEYVRNSVKRSMGIIDRMSVAIDEFRDFYSPKIQRCEFSLNKSIEETLKLFAGVFGEYFIRVNRNCPKEVTFIGYPNEFSQIVFNILNNAKDALVTYKEKLDREVYIELDKDDDLITLIISDNAGGIKKEMLDRIFDPFFTTKEQGSGVGLGLYMSKSIIEKNMDGEISVYNTDKGVAFKILLHGV